MDGAGTVGSGVFEADVRRGNVGCACLRGVDISSAGVNGTDVGG